MKRHELKDFLEEKVKLYNNHNFIDTDPIQIPHRFSQKKDIEISAFLTATLAWGNRKMIINKANELMHCMDDSPYEFILNFNLNELRSIQNFKHRTFNSIDLEFYLLSLQHIYKHLGGLEKTFYFESSHSDSYFSIMNFRKEFLSVVHQSRSEKHLSNPEKGSAAKRINMFLRWMVRKDKQGVDFGIWKNIKPSQLVCPLDTHSGNVARKLGLIRRKQNDWKTAMELNLNLKQLDPKDPVKYDFALFGLGVFENFSKL